MISQSFQSYIVIVPVFNPHSRLLDVIRQLSELDFHSIVVVNDGSTTQQSLFDEIKGVKNLVVLRHDDNQGKGAAIKTAILHVLSLKEQITGVVTVDSDGQHSIEDIKNICSLHKETPERLFLGARVLDYNVPWASRIGNLGISRLISIFWNLRLSDCQTGLRVIPIAFLSELLKIKNNGYDFELAMLFRAKKMGVILQEIKIRTIYFTDRYSHFRRIRDSYKVCKEVFVSLIQAKSFRISKQSNNTEF